MGCRRPASNTASYSPIPCLSGWSRRSSRWRRRQPTGLTANTPLQRPRSRAGAARSPTPPRPLLAAASEGGVHATRGHGRHPAGQHHQAPTVRPGELASEQTAQPAVRARRRAGPSTRAGGQPWGLVAADDLAYCWRSRTLIVLGAWLASSPLALGMTGDRHSTESTLLTGALPMGTAFWVLLTREPAAPHVCSASLGLWLLVARRCGASRCPGLPEVADRGTGRGGTLGLGAVDQPTDPAPGEPGRHGLRGAQFAVRDDRRVERRPMPTLLPSAIALGGT
jgi:hypothetical protein